MGELRKWRYGLWAFLELVLVVGAVAWWSAARTLRLRTRWGGPAWWWQSSSRPSSVCSS